MTRADWEMWCRHTRNIVTVFTLTSLLLMLLYIVAFGMEGDDHGNHGALKPWFDQLRSGKGLCCSFADGKVVKDVDWDVKDGKYRVFLDGKWNDVPDDALITEPNKYGPAVVWPIEYNGVVYSIRCFMPGAGT